MNAEVLNKSKMYKIFNDITLKNEIVILGSAFTANFPFYELSKKYLLSNAIYNRSIDGLTIADANEILEDCIFGAKPSKIFYALGEHDQKNSESLTVYKNILHKTKKALPLSKIYICSVNVVNEDDKLFNNSLKTLCKEFDAEFIDIDYRKSCKSIFRQLSCFFRSGNISFSEAFQTGVN